MSRSGRVAFYLLSSVALAGSARAQAAFQVEPGLALPTEPLERFESCAAYLTFGRAMALSVRPQTEDRQAAAKDMETRATEMVAEAYRLGSSSQTSREAIDKAVQAKADALSELTRNMDQHVPSLATNTAICHRESDGLRAALGAAPKVDPKAGPKEEGDALLVSASAADLFENFSRPDTPVVLRHKASGLVCTFNPHNAANRLVLFEGGPRGDDVGCNSSGIMSGARTWYAKRNTSGQTLDQAFEAYVREVRLLHKNAKPYVMPAKVADSPLLKILASPKLPASRTARFIDGQTYTSVTVALVKDWIVEFRHTIPQAQADLSAGSDEPVTVSVQLLQMIGVAPPVQPPKATAAQ